ncbi:Tyrosine-protein phosphatase non-receptor type 18 [Bagarius yarrelli]|uniref:protein-tyrosine-phosphatase n=1 Tax=Bagarius yarrelli TaxID=175774 RepID=A0A556VB37_BAGYA|nr:Tyrosine-protein phosphatase non-receptor type 18 [Bagarius yarrelli]
METHLQKFINRVQAGSSDGENGIASEYMGATGSRTYIATQGPLKNTIVDFWCMIWQNDIRVIIMACKEIELGKKKCEVYWSPLDGASTFGPFTVSTETRTVFHFQYTAWPDHGIPDMADGILGMMKMKIGEDFSIMELVLELRRQRPAAVQTKEQYEFVFHTVAQMFQKVLQESSQKNQHHNLIQNSQSHYTNVLPPKSALRSFSTSCETQNTRKPPALRPRSSHPRSNNMNDTYAVVNKIRQPAASPRLVPHHYDNENSQKSPTNDLYSIVKPKNRAVANTPMSMVPVYDRTLNQRASADTEYGGYEPMPGKERSQCSVERVDIDPFGAMLLPICLGKGRILAVPLLLPPVAMETHPFIRLDYRKFV